MNNTKKVIVCVLLLFHFVFLAGCGPNTSFLDQREQGVYLTTTDFPNTKWICRELDIVLNMFEYSEYMVGVYEVNDVSYRAVATFEFDQITINCYSSTDVSKSEFSNFMVRCEPILCGYIYATYFFDKKTETIVCSVRNSMPVNAETIPQKLTFEKVGVIPQDQGLRWYAQELDMYLDSFPTVDGYYRGEIILEGKKQYVNALEVGNNNYYMLSIENGKLNNLKLGTTSPLIYMYFEMENDKITAMVSDRYLSETEAFPYWSYSDTIITFTPYPKGEK